jgi:hypothetical protein
MFLGVESRDGREAEILERLAELPVSIHREARARAQVGGARRR